MPTLVWVVAAGVAMSLLALTGSLTLLLPERTFKQLVLPLVALAAGSLVGGALFHLLPQAITSLGNQLVVYGWLASGPPSSPTPAWRSTSGWPKAWRDDLMCLAGWRSRTMLHRHAPRPPTSAPMRPTGASLRLPVDRAVQPTGRSEAVAAWLTRGLQRP
jgi:hypothetical protein